MAVNNSGRRVLLVASSGGHWVQMSKLLQGLADYEVEVATVDLSVLHSTTKILRAHRLDDFNRSSPMAALKAIFGVAAIILKSHATHVISTGAAPGLLAIAIAKVFGKKTLWLDSIANVSRVSLSGRLAHPFVDVFLTQWEPLAGTLKKARYCGRVI